MIIRHIGINTMLIEELVPVDDEEVEEAVGAGCRELAF
jgi:hypothetical protein